jgi:hypothetical protein
VTTKVLIQRCGESRGEGKRSGKARLEFKEVETACSMLAEESKQD